MFEYLLPTTTYTLVIAVNMCFKGIYFTLFSASFPRFIYCLYFHDELLTFCKYFLQYFQQKNYITTNIYNNKYITKFKYLISYYNEYVFLFLDFWFYWLFRLMYSNDLDSKWVQYVASFVLTFETYKWQVHTGQFECRWDEFYHNFTNWTFY